MCRSSTRSLMQASSSISLKPSPPECIRPCGAAVGDLTVSLSRQRGGMLEGSFTLQQGDGSLDDTGVERPIALSLLGYKILDARAKFTVYKILVVGDQGDSWMIFRRYTDFCRLHKKLKELFPSIALALPPKRWLKDNFDEGFLKQRQIRLQAFLHSLALHEGVSRSESVRDFLCSVEPSSPFDCLEAFCGTLEETNHRLQRELLEKCREVCTLRNVLEERENHLRALVKKAK